MRLGARTGAPWARALLLLGLLPGLAHAGAKVETDAEGSVLTVDGRPFFVRGMNWDHYPVGTNYTYSLWAQPDAEVEAVLRREMPLLRAMGVNALRVNDDIPARWVRWIYEEYGIYTMVNPLFGRYGIELDGRWIPNVDYSDPAQRAAIRERTLASVERYKGTPGLLLYLLGNENNYGLEWTSFEIGQLPEGERQAARARSLYSLYGEVVDAVHVADPEHPVAIANGDVQYLSLVKELVPHLDIFGTNVYRGRSAGDLYQVVHDTLGVPVMYTEFGADAFDARHMREDALTQARYAVAQWAEVYEQSRGQGKVGNAIGGFHFQWSDGWWKYKQDSNLDVHDPTASWSNGGYPEDWAEGRNNMNEEWFGICAKGPPDASGMTPLYPRPAYYALQSLWRLDPYAPGTDAAAVAAAVKAADPAVYLPTYETALAAGQAATHTRAWIRDLRLDSWQYLSRDPRDADRPSFDHTESLTLDVGVRPTSGLEAHAAVNVLGNVAENMMDEIAYETRGRDLVAAGPDGLDLSALERVRLYQAGASWETSWFRLQLYHRTGHFHWGYEGDQFGLYREANYGVWTDVYDADAPSGVELHGKRAFEGLSLAMGPQVYWGANPTVIGKYTRRTGPFTWTLMHQEDLAAQAEVTSSAAIPVPMGRKSTLGVELARGPWELQLGGIVAGTEHLGRSYEAVVPAGEGQSYSDSGYHVLTDEIRLFDTLGARAKLSLESGRIHGYVLGDYRGLVAAGGPDAAITFTNWSLRDSGSGNVLLGLAGVAVDVGRLQIAPNLLVQRPLVGPLPAIPAEWDGEHAWYNPAVVPRNVVDDPFVVDGNRETVGGELLLVWDPTPATWFWAWDTAAKEDAPLAGALDLVYRRQPTSRDAALGFTADGTLFTFSDAPPAADTWDLSLRLIGRLAPETRLLTTVYAGQGQSTGDDPRLVIRYGANATLWVRTSALRLAAAFDDWGPYDYHRTFNLTYPFQGLVDLSTGVHGLRLPMAGTRLGLRGKVRTFDEHSPDADTLGVSGAQYEIASYLRVGL